MRPTSDCTQFIALENEHSLILISAWDPSQRGLGKVNPRTIEDDFLVKHLDVAIPVRDGTILRGNIVLPKARAGEKLPVIFNYSLYGKDGGTDIAMFPAAAGLEASRLTKDYLFEAADAGWWCPRGYIVATIDARGSYQSDGDKSYYSRDVGLDGYDLVEWLAAQEWSNGKVALYGASGYAMVQWLVAAERPPSLSAVIPIDGMTDLYREMALKGGIPETQFNPLYPQFYNWGRGLVEDPADGQKSHPYFDEYWQSKIPALEKIDCPAYVICSWGDHAIHTRGTINGYYLISSKVKFLEIHQYQKWEFAIMEESLVRQKAFLDTYLLGHETEVQYWPKVRYAMRERYYVGEWRHAEQFPPPETKYTALFPTQSKGLSLIPQPLRSSVTYDAQKGDASFDLPVLQSLEFAGHVKLKLWVEAKGAENMDLFVTLRKTDRHGKEVVFPWLTVMDNGPIGFGWLRVSRRELDEARSKPWQPYHSHVRDLPPLRNGEIVPVELEIQPTSCRLRSGDTLHVVVSGHDYRQGEYPEHAPIARHTDTVNKGSHVIHFGGDYDSHLLLPVIPPVARSALQHQKPIKMSVIARRVTGWSDEKFLSEYTGVHAEMTKAIAGIVPILRNYTQAVACPALQTQNLQTQLSRPWDCLTTLGWTSLNALWGSFQNPQYKATAGQHVFTDPEAIGVLSEPASELMFDPVAFRTRQNGVLLCLLLAKSAEYEPESKKLADDILARSDAIQTAFAGTSLLRYIFNWGVTPVDPDAFFDGTPFKTADWTSFGALEQFWFPDIQTVDAVFSNVDCRQAIETLPSSFTADQSIKLLGRENIVVSKDADF
ncbi:hypothetical protein H9L39_06126 [Fusarium oxysporum f. sp. albedinis]|nr:hypothetical protein H9L39_06126 [Fusarium oxysporum f. sp. albedinis]